MSVTAETRRNATLVAVVAAGYFVLLVVMSGLGRVVAGADVRWLFGEAPRGWPIQIAAAVAASLGVTLAFRTWTRPAGRVAWAAAALFCVSWPALRSGASADPEFYAALAAVAAAGLTTRWLVERDAAALAWCAGSMAVGALLTPKPAAGLAAALVVAAVVWARLASPPLVGAVVGGLGVGLALRLATPLGQRVPPVPLDPGGLGAPAVWLTLAVVVAMGLWGVAHRRWPHRRNASMVGIAGAAGTIAAGAISGTAVLLPAVAVALIAAGAGMLAAWSATRRLSSPLATAVLVIAACVFAGWQVSLAAGA